MDNLVCYFRGHIEHVDEYHSWCHRCGAIMSEYGYTVDDIPSSLDLDRFPGWLHMVWTWRIKPTVNKRVKSPDDIPF